MQPTTTNYWNYIVKHNIGKENNMYNDEWEQLLRRTGSLGK